MENNNIELGKIIKLFRSKKGLSTYALAELLTNNSFKISQSAISKMENGSRTVDAEILNKFLDLLNIEPSVFFSYIRTKSDITKSRINKIPEYKTTEDFFNSLIKYNDSKPIYYQIKALASSVKEYLNQHNSYDRYVADELELQIAEVIYQKLNDCLNNPDDVNNLDNQECE